MITPGQQAVLPIGTEDIKVIDHADVEQAIAWKNGIIAMHHAEMSDILNEIERWYDVDVVVNGTLPQRDFYFSVSRNANLSDLLRIFEIYHIKYKIDVQNRRLTVNP
jgi:ferric-dicitrate binding protein FerR (iron transport regulator)